MTVNDLPEKFGTATAAKHSGFSQRFINAEIKRKRLDAEDFEGRKIIYRDNYLRWLGKANRYDGLRRSTTKGQQRQPGRAKRGGAGEGGE